MDKKQAGLKVAARLKGKIPRQHLKTDALYTFAYSGDASYFRLVPALVVIVDTQEEVIAVLGAARAERLPVTFRAAGTSLCGQAVTDGILCVLSENWRKIEVGDDGARITLGPSITVSGANAALKPHNRRIGPDPASQAVCKIGGVVSNNASGMCCGVAQNTYNTMERLRLILADGTLLDSGDPASRKAFALARPDMISGLEALATEVRNDDELSDLIRRKYAIKNTVGYSLNALIDFDDPIDMLTHLMVGSEGTLGFIAEITYNTVPDHPHKASALVPFSSNHMAAKGVQALHDIGVSAAEFIERKALACVEHLPAMEPFLPLLSDTSPAVLIEIMAPDQDLLDRDIARAAKALKKVGTLSKPQFHKDPDIQLSLWDVRKGLFASVGASRPAGTLMLTEDVAVPINRLADAVDDLRALLDRHGFVSGIIFGHALAGNLHFQMDADFTSEAEIERFDAFSTELASLVSLDYQGSLKAEHGTGRAVAPFVEQEWGKKAYALMRRIKNLFDGEGLLNPGVLLSDDKKAHVRNIKQMPTSNELVDLCLECGMCEPACPSTGLTLSPRQRIALTRKMAQLEAGDTPSGLLKTLQEGFVYAGMDTCVACNLCAAHCPISIETGTMIMDQRQQSNSALAMSLAAIAAGNTKAMETMMGSAAGAQKIARSLVSNGAVDFIGGALNKISGHKVPKTGKNLRPGPGIPQTGRQLPSAPRGDVIYFPACASRMFGAPQTKLDLLPVTQAMIALLRRAGFNPVVPDDLKGQCCGQPFLSRGFPDRAKQVGNRLYRNILALKADTGTPILTDMSTCALHMKNDGLDLCDSTEFLLALVLPQLSIGQPVDLLAVHHNCSAQIQGERELFQRLAGACAKRIAVLKSESCCGYGGDRGMFLPELNAHALRFAKSDLPEDCSIGVSSVATCAIGLSDNLDIPFVPLASLLEYVSRP